MADYLELEDAVVARLRQHFLTELSESRCMSGNIDAVLDGVFSEGADYGCVIEFNGGYLDSNSSFGKDTWVWSMLGIFFIRFTDPVIVEQNLRQVLGKLKTVFSSDYSLGGLTPRVRIARIESSEPAQINDVPFYWLSFEVQAIDR